MHRQPVASARSDPLRIDDLVHLHRIEILLQAHPRLHLLERCNRNIFILLTIQQLGRLRAAALLQVLPLLRLRPLPPRRELDAFPLIWVVLAGLPLPRLLLRLLRKGGLLAIT